MDKVRIGKQIEMELPNGTNGEYELLISVVIEFKKLADELYEDMENNNEPAEFLGLKAWLPSIDDTNDFYKCNCGDPEKKVCYSPDHRAER